MFRMIVTMLVAAFAVLVVCVAALSEEVKCAGMITKIDGEKITIKTDAQEQQMTVEPATKIVINGKPGDATDLKVGQKVKCLCDKSEGKMLCTSLEIMPGQQQR